MNKNLNVKIFMCENIDIKNREVLILHGFYAVRTGLEPVTSCVTGRHSNQAELTHPMKVLNALFMRCVRDSNP